VRTAAAEDFLILSVERAPTEGKRCDFSPG